MWPDDDDEGPDPDYGVFGDADCPPLPSRELSEREHKEIERLRKREEASKKVSRDFNSYMIELFNRK